MAGVHRFVRRAFRHARWRLSLLAWRRRSAPICDDVAAWARERPGLECHEIFPARDLHTPPPNSIDAEIHPVISRRLATRPRAKYLVAIPEAKLVGVSGLVILQDGSFSTESAYTRNVLEEDWDYRRQRRRPTVVRKPGNYFSLIGRFSAISTNYYHWLHDGSSNGCTSRRRRCCRGRTTRRWTGGSPTRSAPVLGSRRPNQPDAFTSAAAAQSVA